MEYSIKKKLFGKYKHPISIRHTKNIVNDNYDSHPRHYFDKLTPTGDTK